jgi:hypothetical protein
MSHKLIAIVALVAVACLGYLLCNSMELENFFLTRKLSQWCFPKLDPVRRHQRMQIICGVILAVIVTAAVMFRGLPASCPRENLP